MPKKLMDAIFLNLKKINSGKFLAFKLTIKSVWIALLFLSRFYNVYRIKHCVKIMITKHIYKYSDCHITCVFNIELTLT